MCACAGKHVCYAGTGQREKLLETDGTTFTKTQSAVAAELGSGEYRFVYEPENGKE